MTLEGGEEKDETIKQGQVEGRRSGTLCEQQGQSRMQAGKHAGMKAGRYPGMHTHTHTTATVHVPS